MDLTERIHNFGEFPTFWYLVQLIGLGFIGIDLLFFRIYPFLLILGAALFVGFGLQVIVTKADREGIITSDIAKPLYQALQGGTLIIPGAVWAAYGFMTDFLTFFIVGLILLGTGLLGLPGPWRKHRTDLVPIVAVLGFGSMGLYFAVIGVWGPVILAVVVVVIIYRTTDF
ncbi:MAG: hypothetical protein ABEI06_06885 [Halobacteriaceae archaeon]